MVTAFTYYDKMLRKWINPSAFLLYLSAVSQPTWMIAMVDADACRVPHSFTNACSGHAKLISFLIP